MRAPVSRPALACAIAALVAARLLAQNPPVKDNRLFQSGIEITSITATVTDRAGHPVTGLARDYDGLLGPSVRPAHGALDPRELLQVRLGDRVVYIELAGAGEPLSCAGDVPGPKLREPRVREVARVLRPEPRRLIEQPQGLGGPFSHEEGHTELVQRIRLIRPELCN